MEAAKSTTLPVGLIVFPLCLQVSFNAQSVSTEVKPGNTETGCLWNERFSMNVHELSLELARHAQKMDAEGPTITCSVYDCGRYERNDLLGRVAVRLKDLMSLEGEEEDGEEWWDSCFIVP